MSSCCHLVVELDVVEDGCGREQGLGVESRVFNEPRGAGPDHLLGITALMPGRVRVRHHDHRTPNRPPRPPPDPTPTAPAPPHPGRARRASLFLMTRRPPRSTLFPSTTLFR